LYGSKRIKKLTTISKAIDTLALTGENNPPD